MLSQLKKFFCREKKAEAAQREMVVVCIHCPDEVTEKEFLALSPIIRAANTDFWNFFQPSTFLAFFRCVPETNLGYETLLKDLAHLPGSFRCYYAHRTGKVMAEFTKNGQPVSMPVGSVISETWREVEKWDKMLNPNPSIGVCQMLREIPNVQQVPGEATRRWFFSHEQDLIVWFDTDGVPVAFQLAYGKYRNERALRWKSGRGFLHHAVDDGEGAGLRQKQAPLLVADGYFDAVAVLERFLELSAEVPAHIVEFVSARLQEHPNYEQTPNL